jgi:CysZ protein
VVRRAAAGAWHVPAGFALLLRTPRLWPLAALPVILATVLVLLGAVLGIFLIPPVQGRVGLTPGAWPVWVEIPATLLLWTAMIGGGVFLGLALALLLATPVLEQLSRQVEARLRGSPIDSSRGLLWELAQSLRGGFYFLLAAPGVLLLGLIPIVGPLASVLWGGRAVAFQMTDPALTRRGLSFGERRGWHRDWRPESQGFGVAGMIALLIPLANLLVGPALVAGATLLVVSLEPLDPHETAEAPPPGDTPDADDPGDGSSDSQATG